jgi:hypothetical protein
MEDLMVSLRNPEIRVEALAIPKALFAIIMAHAREY